MKPAFTLRMPARQFTPAAGMFNVGCLTAKTWAGVPPRERDRSVLPVLHHRGYTNTAFGSSPSAPAAGSPPGYVEPSPYWGKAGRLVKTPRSIIFGGTAAMALLLASAPDAAALSAGGVFLGRMNLAGTGYNGILGYGIPWASAPSGAYGTIASGPLPVIDPATWTAGDVLVIYQTGEEYYDSTNFVPWAAGGNETALVAHDVAQVAAALGSFRSLRYRLYGGQNNAGSNSFYANQLVTPAVAAGIDASFTPWTAANPLTLANLQNDYHSFFGI